MKNNRNFAHAVRQDDSINWGKTVAVLIAAFVLFGAVILLSHLTELTLVNSLVQLCAIAVLLVSFTVYMYFADREVLTRPRKVATVCAAMLASYCVILGLDKAWQYGTDIAPFALCSLILSLLVSAKSGFIANFIVIILYFMQSVNFADTQVTTDTYFYLLFAGVTSAVYASYVIGKHNRRFGYITSGLTLGVIAAVCRVISYFMFAVDFDTRDFLLKVGCSFASGIAGIMLMFLIVPVFEWLFNVVSVFRFSEIASSNTPLMRKLFEKAPGTYNHSLSVAIYVEACAVAIGESAMLARAAAYYHDVGKLRNPSYFAENQLDGVNPHDGLTPEASVNIIKSHTVNGVAIAKEYKLPLEVQKVIMEHHGTMPIKVFYLKAKKYTDGELPYDGYCYDGPKPTCKISAVLMICDACEAAIRAAGNKSRTEQIVNDIVAERMAFDQFSDCDITMKEIDTIKSTIITTCLGIRHKRVKYPDVKLDGDK